MWHVWLALRELLALNTASFKSRLVAATIRLVRWKHFVRGSPEELRKIEDNTRPVNPPDAVQSDHRITISASNLRDGLVNCPVYTISPSNCESRGTIVYLHGGGYVYQPTEGHWSTLVEDLAIRHTCRVILPVYPKAPNYTFKDAFPPLMDLLEQTAKEGRYLLMGDSAGGGLAIGILLALRDAGRLNAMPTELVLVSPWTDLKLDNPALARYNQIDPWLNLESLQECASMWVGQDSSELVNPWVSPYYGSFTTGIPKITMSIGTREIFYPDQLRFWEKLREESEGQSCGNLVIGPHMVHVYATLSPTMPESVEPWKDIDAAIERMKAVH